jgi:hypothetical protein
MLMDSKKHLTVLQSYLLAGLEILHVWGMRDECEERETRKRHQKCAQNAWAKASPQITRQEIERSAHIARYE